MCEAFFADVKTMASETSSLYNGSHVTDRDALLCFLDSNGWFGMDPEKPLKEAVMAEGRIRLWLQAYKRTGEEKTGMQLGAFREKYPDTARRQSELFAERGKES